MDADRTLATVSLDQGQGDGRGGSSLGSGVSSVPGKESHGSAAWDVRDARQDAGASLLGNVHHASALPEEACGRIWRLPAAHRPRLGRRRSRYGRAGTRGY